LSCIGDVFSVVVLTAKINQSFLFCPPETLPGRCLEISWHVQQLGQQTMQQGPQQLLLRLYDDDHSEYCAKASIISGT
jgi:hypothetical protein